MIKIEIFERALCCATGVCGPSVEPELIEITGLAERVNKTKTARMLRRNLAQNPESFVKNETVKSLLAEKGADCLPITLVDGEVLEYGKYPSAEEISAKTGIDLAELTI